MKKNWTTKLAVALLALTMITSCFVGSTFAKYVTGADAEAEGRVAAFGVVVTGFGNPFDTQYPATDEAYLEAGGEYSVVASNDDYVVAPGTSAEQLDRELGFTINGTPEVAVRYTLTGTVTDVCLPAGTYTDYTKAVPNEDGEYGYTEEFTLAKDYTPIKWNLVISKGNTSMNVADALYDNLPANLIEAAEAYGLTRNGCSFFSAVEILKKVAGNEGYVNIVNTALSQIVSGGRNFQLDVDDEGNFTLSYDFDPNKNMDFTFELTWEWAYEQEDVELYDKADTFLGNWAAVLLGQQIEGFVAPTDPKASTTISATITGTATQID